MKVLFAILFLAGLICSESTMARSSTASPLLGSWAVDVSKLPIPQAARPRRVTIRFSDAGRNRWSMDVDIVDAGGAEIHSVGTVALDGSPAHVQGSPEADTGAMKHPASNVLILALAKDGVGASTRIYTAQPDGQSMIETAVYFGHDGVPIMRTNHFRRIR